ncbi:MAG: two-component sensor histidine kinase [Nonomuraea muscovyensis]|nr:two-component sensor histidine kinase [Nonomuraea muscovyensis]
MVHGAFGLSLVFAAAGVAGEGDMAAGLGGLLLGVLYAAAVVPFTGDPGSGRYGPAWMGLALVTLAWGVLAMAAAWYVLPAVPLVFAWMRLVPLWAATFGVTVLGCASVVSVARQVGGVSAPTVLGPLAVAAVAALAALRRPGALRPNGGPPHDRPTAPGEPVPNDRPTAPGEPVPNDRPAFPGEPHQRRRAPGAHRRRGHLPSGRPGHPYPREEPGGERPGPATRHDPRTAVGRPPAEPPEPAGTPPGPTAGHRRLRRSSLVGAVRRLSDATAARARIPVRFGVSGAPVELPPAHDMVLLRVARGVLGNVGRHSGARNAGVTLAYLDDLVMLYVSDDGRGFDPYTTTGRDLREMRERVEALGGTLTVRSAPGGGTAVVAGLPR